MDLWGMPEDIQDMNNIGMNNINLILKLKNNFKIYVFGFVKSVPEIINIIFIFWRTISSCNLM